MSNPEEFLTYIDREIWKARAAAEIDIERVCLHFRADLSDRYRARRLDKFEQETAELRRERSALVQALANVNSRAIVTIVLAKQGEA